MIQTDLEEENLQAGNHGPRVREISEDAGIDLVAATGEILPPHSCPDKLIDTIERILTTEPNDRVREATRRLQAQLTVPQRSLEGEGAGFDSEAEKKAPLSNQDFIAAARDCVNCLEKIKKMRLPDALLGKVGTLIADTEFEIHLAGDPTRGSGAPHTLPSHGLRDQQAFIETTMQELFESELLENPSDQSVLRILLEKVLAFFSMLFSCSRAESDPDLERQQLVRRVSQFFSCVRDCAQPPFGQQDREASPARFMVGAR